MVRSFYRQTLSYKEEENEQKGKVRFYVGEGQYL